MASQQSSDYAASSPTAANPHARLIDIADHDDVHEFMFDQGITDGLPVVPPTRERVDRMLAASPEHWNDPSAEIAKLPPNYGPLTVEKAAINAVMAGCAPSFFPTVLASIEAAADPRFPLHGSIATTAGLAPLMLVNGPVREQIGMNWGLNALGQGNRANSTLGRALRLMLRNVGGAVPGEIEQAIQGGGHKWTLSYAEDEDTSPWDPFHVEHGWNPEDSVVSLLATTGGPRVCIDQTSRTARALTGSIAMAFQQVVKPRGQVSPTMFVVSPEHADVYRADGWTKENIREAIMEFTALPLRDRLASPTLGGGINEYAPQQYGLTEEQLDLPMSKVAHPSFIQITVAGSHAGKWTSIYQGIFGDGDPTQPPPGPFVPPAARVRS